MRWFTPGARRQISRLSGLGERTAARLDRETWRLLDRFEPLGRAIRNVTTLEAFDLGLILAAQAFLTVVPLVIVLAAFAPRLLGLQLSSQLQGALGLANSSLAFQGILAGPGRAARVGGVIGLILLLSAGVSFVSALQRAYERTWQLPRLRIVRSAWRAVAWLIVSTVGFVLSGLADAALRGVPGDEAVLTLIGLAGAVLFWWWTPHLLLGARVGWRALLPTAVVTGLELAVLVWLSPLIMPTLVATTEGEFGPIGTVFVVMIWLTIVCSMVVFGAIIGEVIARERRVALWTRPPAPQVPHASRGAAPRTVAPGSPPAGAPEPSARAAASTELAATPVPPPATPASGEQTDTPAPDEQTGAPTAGEPAGSSAAKPEAGAAPPDPPPPAASETGGGGAGGPSPGPGETTRAHQAGTAGGG